MDRDISGNTASTDFDSAPVSRADTTPRRAGRRVSKVRPPAPTVTTSTELTAVEVVGSDVQVPKELAQFLATNEAEGLTQYQRSLDLFDEGTQITEARNDLLLKKSSQRIRFETSLTLLQKKLLNALLFVARPTLSGREMFSVPVDYLSWCVSHDRSDMGYLKDSLKAMKRTIEVEEGEKWLLTSLLADVLFDGKNIIYDIPPLVRRAFSAPKRYYYISMVANARCRSKYSHSLYEMLKEFEYRGETPVMTIEEFRERMGVEKHEYPEFKRLSARTITGPLQELEEMSDLTATVDYATKGRKIVGIMFYIKPNPKNQFPTDSNERIRPEYWTMLKDEFGLNRSQLDEVTRVHSAKRVEEVCDVLFYRYITKKKEIKNGFKLVSSGLNDTEGKYHLTNREKDELAVLREREQTMSVEQKMRDAQVRAHEARVAEFNHRWATWSDQEQQFHWSVFVKEPEFMTLQKAKLVSASDTPNLNAPMVHSAFMNYLLRTGRLGD
ncbi:MAG: replication initiation protein [Verrucomicrobium sp.]|nr:replication initiation protein [Verrucomicrobium sp.]